MQRDLTHNYHQAPVKDSGFTFCHCPATLKGIVMLADHQTIIDKLLKDAIQPNYFWIYENTEKVQSLLQELPEHVKKSSFVFSKIYLMKQFFPKQSKDGFRKIVIVCQTSLKVEVQNELRGQAFVGKVFYNLNEDKINQGKIEDEGEQKKQQYNISKGVHCSDIKQLKNLLKQSPWSFAEEKQFTTFVLLRQQVEKSTMLSRIICAMIQQQLSLEVRKQVFVELNQLVSSLCKFHRKLSIGESQLQKAFEILQKGCVSNKYIIRLYSSEKHQLYVLLNSFLRGLNCPTELYYIQPIVKDLFEAIKNVEGRQKKEDFICYRGGFMSLEEFLQIGSAVGEVIQNLGFLSASKNQEVAETFSQNVIFEIDVKDTPGELRNGFAYISPFSQFVAEEEVLFNPFNYFKVVEVTQTNKRDNENNPSFFIVLQYLTSIINGEDNKNQHIEVTKTLLKLHAEINQSNSKQIHVILKSFDKEFFLQAQIFFNFINKKVDQEFERIRLILNHISGTTMDQSNVELNERDNEEIFEYLLIACKVGNLLTQNFKLKESMQLLKKCKILAQFIAEEKKYIAFQIQVDIGRNLLTQQRFEQALRIFRKIKQMGRQVFKDQNMYYESLISLASNLTELNRYEEAMEILNETLKLRKQINGEMHPKIQSIIFQIGMIYQMKGEYHKSIDYFSKSLEIQKNILGEKHPYHQTTSFNLAYSLMMIDKERDALKILRRSVGVQKIELGSSHFLYLASLNLMIDIFQKLGKLGEAFHLCKILIHNTETYYGEDFPLYFSASISLVNLLITTGKLKNAIFLNQKINKKLIKSQIQTTNIFRFAELLFQNGQCYHRLWNHKKALEIFQKCYSILKKKVPETHHTILVTFEWIGRTYLCLDQHEKALNYLQKCQDHFKNKFGEKNNLYLKIIECIGHALWKMSKFNKSLKVSLKFYNLWIQINGEDNPTSQNLLFIISRILKDLGQTQKGFSMLKNYRETSKICHSARSLFFQRLILYALQIGYFEQTQIILEKFPMPLVFRQYSFQLQILVRIPKFTLFLDQFQKYICHCKEETKKLYGEVKKNKLKFLSLKERELSQLRKKRKVQRNREKGKRSWMFFVG